MMAVAETPHDSAHSALAIQLDARSDQAPFSNLTLLPLQKDMVKTCGLTLYDCLHQIPRFSGTRLDAAYRTPIYFKLESPASENLPWEALWHQDRFIALEPNWPIARLPPTSRQRDRTPWIEPEITILLVLAAAWGAGPEGVSAVGEWEAIWRQLQAAPSPGRLRVHVLTCQMEILEQIELVEEGDVRVTGELLASAQTFHQAVSILAPNIVHFFCHGDARDSEPQLNLATMSDYDAENAVGRIFLGIAELGPLARNESLWLITLNCCQGARATGGVHSLAAKLAEQGVPAVVAMRESVDFRKAHTFAGEYYRALISSLTDLLPSAQAANDGESVTIPEQVWLDSMYLPRVLLAGQERHQDPAWTLPVVYMHRGELKLRARPRSASVMMLLQLHEQAGITKLRTQAATFRTLEVPATDDTSTTVRHMLVANAERYEREADELERRALQDYVRNGVRGISLRVAQERLSDLMERYPTGGGDDE
jgi:hypothetical protein